MSEITKRLLIVDDDQNILHALERLFHSHSLEVITARDVKSAFASLKKDTIHVVISDYMMPSMTGTEFLCHVKDMYPDIVRIMLTGQADMDVVIKSINKGEIFRFVTKPWNNNELLTTVEDAFNVYDVNQRTLQFCKAAEQALEAIIITDANHIALLANAAFCLMTEYGSDEIVGKKIHLFKNPDKEKAFLETLYKNGTWSGEVTLVKKQQRPFTCRLTASTATDQTNRITKLIYNFVDVTEEKQQSNMKHFYQAHDPITGLANLEYFQSEFTRYKETAAQQHKHLLLLSLELCNLRNINSEFGMAIGDELLKGIADRLKILKGKTGVAARVGGATFVLLQEYQQEQDIIELTKLVNERFLLPLNIKGHLIKLDYKLSYSRYPDDAVDYDKLLQAARYRQDADQHSRGGV